MAGSTEPDEQLAEQRHDIAAAASLPRPRGRSLLVLCAVAVVAASAGTARWLGAAAALGVYLAGTLALVAALLVLARRPGPRPDPD